MIKTIINTYWQSTIVNGVSFLRPMEKEQIRQTRFLIHLFYFFTLLTSIQTFSSYYQFPEWNVILESRHLFEPLWSIMWIPPDKWEFCVRLILMLFLIFSFLGLILWNHFRFVRIGVFLSCFSYLSLISSFGKIDHYLHLMVIASFLLIFIPNKKSTDSADLDLLKIFFGIQTLILLTYFVSGFFKLYGILDQEILGLISAFSPDSLARNMSKTSLALNADYFLSDFLLNISSPVFSIVLIIGYLIEFFAIYIIFKPGLHKIWGLLLILLHTGILLTVGPDFTIQIILVGIFLLFSPFKDSEADFFQIFLTSFKSIKKYFYKRKEKNEIIVFYDGECLMCNRFLNFISKFDLPSEIRICKIQSAEFEQLKKEKPSLNEIDSIVVLEKKEDNEKIIRLKAKGIVWVLSKVNIRFLVMKFAYMFFPFIGNCIYDLVTKNRKKKDSDSCPILPVKMREIMLD